MKNDVVKLLEQTGKFISTWQEAPNTAVEAEALSVVWLCHELLCRTTLVRLNPELIEELPAEALEPWEPEGTMQHRFAPAASPVADAAMAMVAGRGYIDLVDLLEAVKGSVPLKEVARRASVPYSTAVGIANRTSEPAANIEKLLNAALPTYTDEALASMNYIEAEMLRTESEAFINDLLLKIDALEASGTIAVGRRLMVNAHACTRAINPRWIVAEYDVCEVVHDSGRVFAYLKGRNPFKEVRVK